MNDTEWLNAIEKYGWHVYYNHESKDWIIKDYVGPQFRVIHKTLRAALHLAYLKQLAW